MVSLTLPARIGRRRHSPIRHIDGGAIYPRHGGVVGLYRVGGVDVLGQAPAERDAR